MKTVVLKDPNLSIISIDKISPSKIYLYMEEVGPEPAFNIPYSFQVLILVPIKNVKAFAVINYLNNCAEEWNIEYFKNLLRFALEKKSCTVREFDSITECMDHVQIVLKNFK